MRRPRASSRQPMEAAARPLPRLDTTPPVTKMYFADTASPLNCGFGWRTGWARSSIAECGRVGKWVCGADFPACGTSRLWKDDGTKEDHRFVGGRDSDGGFVCTDEAADQFCCDREYPSAHS